MHSISYWGGPVRTYKPGDPDYPGIPKKAPINPFQYRPNPIGYGGIKRVTRKKPAVLSRQARINSLGNKKLATDVLTVLGYQELNTTIIFHQVGRPRDMAWFREFMKKMEEAELVERCGKSSNTNVWRATDVL